jgi:hypothetical protein
LRDDRPDRDQPQFRRPWAFVRVVAGVLILLFILFLSPLIERIPLAALVG